MPVCVGQLSLSFGALKRSEQPTFYSDSLFKELFKSSFHNIYRHDYFNLTVGYDKQLFSLQAEVGFTATKQTFRSISRHDHVTNHGQAHDIEIGYHDFSVGFGYMNVKLAPSIIIFRKKSVNLIVGPFVQMDVLLYENERNHKDSTVMYNSYNLPNNPPWSTTPEYTVSYAPFNGLQCNSVLFSGGIGFQLRYTYKKIQFLPVVSLGIMSGTRAYEAQASTGWPTLFDPYDNLFYGEVGLKIGYVFGKTKEE